MYGLTRRAWMHAGLGCHGRGQDSGSLTQDDFGWAAARECRAAGARKCLDRAAPPDYRSGWPVKLSQAAPKLRQPALPRLLHCRGRSVCTSTFL